ncbi:MAG TPA: hypothetical protein VHJ82_00900 [Actinomycetota bacterium]|nr:hypothetical protein [Actinomycetota bacterium]
MIEFVSAAGLVAGLFSMNYPPVWRALDGDVSRWHLVGPAVAAAWAMVVAVDRGAGNWQTGALVGVAATGMAFFAATGWLVPALIFWGCSSLALGALIHREASSVGRLLGLLAAADVAFIAGVLAQHAEEPGWMLGSVGHELPAGLWFAALVLRGLLAAALIHAPGDGRALPGVPLALGGGLLLLGRIEDPFSQGVVLLMLIVAAVVGVGAVISPDRPPVVGMWVITVSVSLALAVPQQSNRAAVAAILGAAAIGLWGLAEGRGHFARAFLIGLTPLGAGYGALALAHAELFSTAGGGRMDRAALALVSVVAALGVIVSVRVARAARSESWQPLAWLATLLFAGLSVWLGLPMSMLGAAALPLGVPAVVAAVSAIALIAGLAAFALGYRGLAASLWPIPDEPPLQPAIANSTVIPTAVIVPALLVWVAGFAAIVWTTIAGLRVGFL